MSKLSLNDMEGLLEVAMTDDSYLGRLAGAMWITLTTSARGAQVQGQFYLPYEEGGELTFLTGPQVTQLYRWMIGRLQRGEYLCTHVTSDPTCPSPASIQWVGADKPLILPTLGAHYRIRIAIQNSRIKNLGVRGEDVSEEHAEIARLEEILANLPPEEQA